jgi:hypothetical protein
MGFAYASMAFLLSLKSFYFSAEQAQQPLHHPSSVLAVMGRDFDYSG